MSQALAGTTSKGYLYLKEQTLAGTTSKGYLYLKEQTLAGTTSKGYLYLKEHTHVRSRLLVYARSHFQTRICSRF